MGNRSLGKVRILLTPWLAVVFLSGTALAPYPAVTAVTAVTAVSSMNVDRAGPGDERLVFRFRDQRIAESSGLAVSPTHRGIIYTHNDSGDGPRFFAVGLDGRTRATFTVAGAIARDWEGMAASVDPRTGEGVLWIADIGDNHEGAWPDISVYKIREPRTLRDATVRATRYRFWYADGPRNAEGVLVHPRTGRLYIVSKEFTGSVYAAPATLRTDRVNVLRRVGPAPIMATDAAYAPDGSSFVIRTYFSASIYRAPGDLITRVTMPPLDQAESIAYTADGTALLTGSEGRYSPVYQVPLPDGVPRGSSAASRTAGPSPAHAGPAQAGAPNESARAARSTPAPAAGEGGGVPVSMVVLWLAVATAAIGVIAAIAYRTGR